MCAALVRYSDKAGAGLISVSHNSLVSECVEIGRALLPKTFEGMHVWEWQAPTLKQPRIELQIEGKK